MKTKNGPKGKGTESKGKAATKGTRVAKTAPAPEAVAGETPIDETIEQGDAETGDEAPADAPVEETATTEPTAKRKRDMSIDDLRAEFLRVVGRETTSTNRRFLLWRLSPGGLRRSPAEPRVRKAARPKEAMQVLPLGMARETVAKLDAAWKALGFKNRMSFLRDAMIAKLRFEGTQADAAPAILEAADALQAESAT